VSCTGRAVLEASVAAVNRVSGRGTESCCASKIFYLAPDPLVERLSETTGRKARGRFGAAASCRIHSTPSKIRNRKHHRDQ